MVGRERVTGDPQRGRVVAVASTSGPYKELSAFAEALGIAYAGGLELQLLVDGRPVKLSLQVSSGVVGALAIVVELDPRGAETPHIELRKESDEDRAAKAQGITREVQTGYEPFDGKVFVDNEASEADALRLLAAPSTRDALLGLLESDCQAVKLTPRAVTASCSLPGPVFPAERVLRALEQALVVARAGGPRERARRSVGARLVGLLGVLFLPSALFAVLACWKWNAGVWLPVVGAAAGVVLAIASRSVLRWLAAGDSGSLPRYQTAQVVLLLVAPTSCVGLLATLNGALDAAAPVTISGTVIAVDDYEPAGSLLTNYDVRWSDGSTSREASEESPSVGDTVVETHRPGALGFRWNKDGPHRVRPAP